MSRFVDRAATDEIVLANGDRVQVRQRLTAPEQIELDRALAPVRFDSGTGQLTYLDGDWHGHRIALVRAYAVGWDFKDDRGEPVPFNRDLVDTLDMVTVDEIARGLNRLHVARREADAKKGAPP